MKRKQTYAVTLALIHILCLTAHAITPAAKEFADGRISKLNTTGHPKAKGLKMSISYPSSWIAKEGERPNIVQKIISDGGRGLEMVMIITKPFILPLGNKMTEKDFFDFFTSNQMKELIPPGATFHSSRATRIEGLPAGILEYTTRQDRAGMTIDMRMVVYVFIHSSVMVMIQCGIASPPTDSSALALRMAEFTPLFTLMANSIILEDKWK